MNRWRAIVFDLDDTLYPERDYVLSGFHAVAVWAETALGIPAEQCFTELTSLFEQGVRSDTFNRWLAAHSLSHYNLVAELVTVYREHQPQLAPLPNVPKLLRSLHHHYRLGLVSDGYLGVQQRKLAALNLADYFDAVIFSDQLGREAWKPSTKPFKAVLKQLAVRATKAVYIADNPAKDFLGARRVGMFTVWVRRPDGEYADLTPPTPHHTPDLTIRTLAELEQLLVEWGT